MVILVVTLNLLISLMGLYITWRVTKLRHTLAHIADRLVAIERSTHHALHDAPQAIVTWQRGAYELRHQYHHLQPQLQRIQQLLSVLTLMQSLWRWRSPSKHQITPLSKLNRR